MDNFDFCFKAERNYVHGSDIYNALARYLQENHGDPISRIELSIHRLSYHNMLAEAFDAGQPHPSLSPVVKCGFDVGEQRKVIHLVETDAPVDCRYAFDEESIVRSSQIIPDRNSITLRNRTPYSPIEIIIALNKELVQVLFAGEQGKWLFTKLTLDRLLPDSSDTVFALEFRRALGSRLTSTAVSVANEYYGEIYFSSVKGLRYDWDS